MINFNNTNNININNINKKKILQLLVVPLLVGILLITTFNNIMQSTPIPTTHTRTLFVIAHPDDEAMFFAPTILHMHDKSSLHLVCLSVGNNDGLGKIRQKELYKSCAVLGIPEARVRILDEDGLQDGMKNHWDSELVMEHVKSIAEEFDINTIITFDENGISSHPNHIDTYKGVKRFLSSQNKVIGYKLETTNIIRKFISWLDVPLSWGFKSNSTLFYVSKKMRLYFNFK